MSKRFRKGDDPWALIASWSDTRLAHELDQAAAVMNDDRQDPAYRESAFCAAVMMATALEARKPVDIEAIEAALPNDGGSPYVCPECLRRLKDIGGYWGCDCSGRWRDGKQIL